jgi:hypothetical protein
MSSRPTNVPLLSALAASAMAVSGCVTTAAFAPASLPTIAGLPENREAKLHTSDGLDTVSGSTEVTLRSRIGRDEEVDEVRLSRLRYEAGALVLPDDGKNVMLSDVWGAEITKPSPGKTAGLVVGIVLGTVVLAVATFFVAGAIALSNANF